MTLRLEHFVGRFGSLSSRLPMAVRLKKRSRLSGNPALQLCSKKDQTRMTQERTAKKLLFLTPACLEAYRDRPRTRLQVYVEDLNWYCLGILPELPLFVAKDQDAWRLKLEQLPP